LEKGEEEIRKIIEDMKINFIRQIEALKYSSGSTNSKSLPAGKNDSDKQYHNEHIIESRILHLIDDRINQLLKMIDKKADRADVEDLERRVTDKLNELIKNMIDRFADKREVAKRFALIDKQVGSTFIFF
jgi:hypothetical protein